VPFLLILGQERQRHAGERTEDDDRQSWRAPNGEQNETGQRDGKIVR
jgi:hypothetical protein